MTARPSGAHEALLEFQAWWSRTNVELKPRSSTAAANSWLSSVPSPFVSYYVSTVAGRRRLARQRTRERNEHAEAAHLLEKGLKTASLLRCHIESPKEVFIHLNRAVAVVVD